MGTVICFKGAVEKQVKPLKHHQVNSLESLDSNAVLLCNLSVSPTVSHTIKLCLQAKKIPFLSSSFFFFLAFRNH